MGKVTQLFRTSVPSHMSNISSLFKTQGHDKIKTKQNYSVVLMRQESSAAWHLILIFLANKKLGASILTLMGNKIQFCIYK
jgi:hypothetical protein